MASRHVADYRGSGQLALRGDVGMTAPTSDAPTDAVSTARRVARPGLPHWIRRLSVPMILA